jgi:hypothetical protein
MSYHPFTAHTLLTESEFIAQMNLAIRDDPNFVEGMQVKFNSSGYWLELDGKSVEDPDMILARAHNAVLKVRD